MEPGSGRAGLPARSVARRQACGSSAGRWRHLAVVARPRSLAAGACGRRDLPRVAGPALLPLGRRPGLRGRAGADPGPESADRCDLPARAGRTPAARSFRSAAEASSMRAGAPRTGRAVPHRRPGPAAAGAWHRAGCANRRAALRYPSDRRVSRTQGERQQTHAGRDQITMRSHASCPWSSPQPVVATVVTARRFWPRLESLWPGSAGRSSP